MITWEQCRYISVWDCRRQLWQLRGAATAYSKVGDSYGNVGNCGRQGAAEDCMVTQESIGAAEDSYGKW